MFTIIYTAEDNGEQDAYGRFKTREAAERRMARMAHDLRWLCRTHHAEADVALRRHKTA